MSDHPEVELSVVIPAYNEEATLEDCVRRVYESDCGLVIESVIVDDGSTDGTDQTLERIAANHPRVRVLRHERNLGKGAALRTAFQEVSGRYVVVQDADLEYDPAEYRVLLAPLMDGRADVVYGSRFLGGAARAHLYLNYLANRFLTTLSNLMTNLNLTDMETCYKAFRVEVVRQLRIVSNGFSVEPEITAKVARMRARIFEVSISYSGRDYAEGKKIRWIDGVYAFLAILRFNFFPGKITRLERPRPDSRTRGN